MAPPAARVIRYVYFPGTRSGYRYDYSSYGMIYRVVQLRQMTVSTTDPNQTGSVTSEGQTAATTEYNYPVQPSFLAEAPAYTRRTDDWAGRTAGMNGTSEAPYHTFAVDKARGVSAVRAPDGTETITSTVVNPGSWDDGLVREVVVRQGDRTFSRAVTR